MPNWKKVITSGSTAVLNEITSSGGIYSAQDIYSRESKLGRDTYLERLVTLGTEPSLDSTANTSIDFLTRNSTSGQIERHSLGSNAFNSTGFTTCTGTVTGTGVNNQVTTWNGTTSLDGSSNFTYDGTTLDLTYTGTGDLLRLTSTDAGASSAPDLTFCRNSASPADNDTLGTAQFWGKSTAANKLYAAIYGRIACATSGQTKGNISFKQECDNVFIDTANFSPHGLYVLPPSFNSMTTPGIGLTVTGGISGSTNIQIGSGHNIQYDDFSSIAGGRDSEICSSTNAFIGGGRYNSIHGSGGYTVIGGGYNNCIVSSTNQGHVIAGGSCNIATNGNTGGGHTIVVGGCKNCANGNFATIVGGMLNTGSGACSFIGGGCSNNITLSSCFSGIVTGEDNYISSLHNFIGGGKNNCLILPSSSIAGGFNNSSADKSNVHILGSDITADKSNYTFVNNLDVETNTISSTLSLTGLANQASASTAVMINGSNVVGTRELGSNAFNSTAFTTCTGTSNLTLGTTSTTALAGNTKVDDVSITNLKIRLAGGFGSNAVQIGDSTDTVTIPGDLVVTGTTTTNNVETVSTSNGVVFEGNAADAYEGTLLAGLLTGDRTYTLPDQTGTIAISSDIPNNNNQIANGCGYITDGNTNWDNTYGFTTCTGTLTGNGTSTYIPFYNGTTSFGNTNKLIWDGTKLVTAALNIALQPAQNSEATSLMINSSGDVGTRELGSNAFNSTAFTTCTGTVTMSGGVNNRILTAGGTTSIIGESGLTYDGQSFCVDSLGNYFLADRSQFGCNNAGLGKIDISDDNFGGELGIMTDDDETIAVKVASCTFEYGGTEPFDSAICVVANYKNVFLNKTSGNSTFGSCNIVGGNLNYINGNQSIVASGNCNCISTGGGYYNTIVGGTLNCVKGNGSMCSANFIGGGCYNKMEFGTIQTIVGGYENKILDTACNYPKSESRSAYAIIGAGCRNQIDGACFAFIGSGGSNCILVSNSGTIAGGCSNSILCQNLSSILGGNANQIKNSTAGNYHTIGGGNSNVICGYISNTIAGGSTNVINTCSYGSQNTIGGGIQNCICGSNCSGATIAGGCCNRICNALASTIGGGKCNLIKDQALAFVGGGFCNRATGYASSIIGGEYNNVCLNSNYSSILGGCMNNICHSDYASTVGRGNCVKHDYSHAIGCCLASTTTKTTYMNNATVACHLQVGGTTTLNTTTGRIDATNDVVAFATSDRRLKENIQPIENALCKVIGVSGNTFDWKSLSKEEIQTIHGNTGRDVGVIAQEIESILPEAVTTRDNGYKAVNYEKIVPLLIEAIKEQQKQIDELKSKV